jgi:hypothetical protein
VANFFTSFATDVNDNGGKLPPVPTTPAANLPPLSFTPVANNGSNYQTADNLKFKIYMLALLPKGDQKES